MGGPAGCFVSEASVMVTSRSFAVSCVVGLGCEV
mgnify:CR=1 FL=1|jgi:hypothetical protein